MPGSCGGGGSHPATLMPPKLPPSSEVRARWSECLRACVGVGVGGGCLAGIADLSLVHGFHLCSVAASRILPCFCARLLIWWVLLFWQLATRARATNSTAGPIATPSVDTPHSAHPHVQPPRSVGWCVALPQTLPFSLTFPFFHLYSFTFSHALVLRRQLTRWPRPRGKRRRWAAQRLWRFTGTTTTPIFSLTLPHPSLPSSRGGRIWRSRCTHAQLLMTPSSRPFVRHAPVPRALSRRSRDHDDFCDNHSLAFLDRRLLPIFMVGTERDGFVVLRGVVQPQECRRFLWQVTTVLRCCPTVPSTHTSSQSSFDCFCLPCVL